MDFAEAQPNLQKSKVQSNGQGNKRAVMTGCLSWIASR
jgi:hypothetical protein